MPWDLAKVASMFGFTVDIASLVVLTAYDFETARSSTKWDSRQLQTQLNLDLIVRLRPPPCVGLVAELINGAEYADGIEFEDHGKA